MSGHGCGYAPRKGPAITVEHWQCPQVNRLSRQAHGSHVAQSVQVGTAMVINTALRVTGGARRIEQGQGLPLVIGLVRVIHSLAFCQQAFVIGVTYKFAVRRRGIIDIDHQ